MINCIIVDDEQHAIDILIHYIRQIPYLYLAGATTNPIEALQIVSTQKIDLIFLDIQMPELTGIDFMKAFDRKSMVILTTAYSEFALDGYDLEVLDYLLKPIRLPRFLTAVQKAIRALNISEAGIVDKIAESDFVFVKTEAKGKLLKINFNEIDYIEGMKNYVAIFRGEQKTMVYTTIKEIETHLPEKQFIRVHKSFIISIAKITGIEGNVLLLKNMTSKILIGDNFKAGLMEIIKNKMLK